MDASLPNNHGSAMCTVEDLSVNFQETHLTKQVAMCSKSIVYGTKKLKGGKEQVKASARGEKGHASS